jgi:hypothetical protein
MPGGCMGQPPGGVPGKQATRAAFEGLFGGVR